MGGYCGVAAAGSMQPFEVMLGTHALQDLEMDIRHYWSCLRSWGSDTISNLLLATPLVHRYACSFAGGGRDTFSCMFALHPRSFGIPASRIMSLELAIAQAGGLWEICLVDGIWGSILCHVAGSKVPESYMDI